MKRILCFLVLIVVAFGTGLVDRYVPARLMILVPPEFETTCEIGNDGFLQTGISSIDALNEAHGVTGGRYLTPIRKMNAKFQQKNYQWRNLYILEFDNKEIDIIELARIYAQIPEVEISTPDWIKEVYRTTPNDPRYSSAWHLPKIRADYAWDFQTGSSDVVVTCLEGSDWKHPDLAPVVWNNLGEDADGDGVTIEPHYSFAEGGYIWRFDPDDINGIDDDGNGYTDDLIGWDFLEDMDDPEYGLHPEEDMIDEDMDPMDDIGYIGHGTHVSGTMSLASNNGWGTAAVSWHSAVAILRTDYVSWNPHYMDWSGAHNTSATIGAFLYGNMMDFDVYCLSYGGYSYSGMVSSVLRVAQDSSNVFICAAAGNENTEELSYPASYTRVMGVAASTQMDIRADFSNYGDRVDISAPGVNIWSAMPVHNLIGGDDRAHPYEGSDGTSMAAPVIGGAAALLFSQYPDSSYIFVYERLEETAAPMPDEPFWDDGLVGSGRVDIYAALFQHIYPHFELENIVIYPDIDDEDGRINISEEGRIFVSYTSDPEWQNSGDITMTLSSDDEGITNVIGSVSLPSVDAGDPVNNDDSPLTFTPDASFIDGRRVVFTVRLESSSGYFREDTISAMIGYPAILLYDRDGDSGAETYIMSDLEMGQVQYDHYDADILGAIDTDFLIANFKTIVFVAGANEEVTITEDDVTAFDAFLSAGGGRNMLFSGQYAADSPLITDLLATHFKAEHLEDGVNRFWALNVIGMVDDTVTGGAHISASMGTDCMGPQHSPGTCAAIDDGIRCLVYQDHWSDYCAVRHEEVGKKTFFMEFSISGVHGMNPTGLTRYQLLYRILEWFGHPFLGVDESKVSRIPTKINHRAFPNPFNPVTTIEFELPQAGDTRVDVYDLSGRLVLTPQVGNLDKGIHKVTVNPNQDNSSGVYFYRITSGNHTAQGRILLLK